MSHDDDDEKQSEEWERLYNRVKSLLAEVGVDDAFGRGDYLLVDDNYGWRRIKIEAQRLIVFRLDVVTALRALLDDMPGWEIVVAVDVPEHEQDWPVMGLTIRRHEIIDGLQREFLPPEFADLHYPGGRPGTGYD
jgi:hypothetical protein